MKFSYKILAGKVIKRAIQGLLAWAIAAAAQHGISLDMAELMVASLAGLEALRNFLKHKVPAVFGWL